MSNGGPKTVQDWIKYLHAAAAVPPGHPDHAEAREAVEFALQRIHNLNIAANVAEQEQIFQEDKPSLFGSLAGEALHTAGAGTGELFSGVYGLRPGGPGFSGGAQEYREALDRLEETNPTAAGIGNIVGLVGPSAAASLASGAVRAGAPVVRAGVPLATRTIAGAVGRGAGTGATLGGLSGFSGGGGEAGDIGARLEEGARGALVGGVLGAAGGGIGLRLGRRGVERRADLLQRGQERSLAAEKLTEARLRSKLLRQGVARGKARDAPPVRATELPFRGDVRAGAVPDEVIIARALERAKPDPLDVPTFQRRSPTAPRGVGGHSFSGTYQKGTRIAAGAERTVPSPVARPMGNLAAKQSQAIQEALAKARPEEIPQLLANLRDMGILTEAQVAEVLQGVTP